MDRSKTLPLVLLLALAAGAFALACSRQEGPPAGGSGSATNASTAAMSHEDSVAMGLKLTTIGGCNDCHTPGVLYGAPDMTRQLSGSELGWAGPWGVTFPRNLTPDVETGLGSWSAGDIVRAIRTGQRPDGSPILPPMPWPNYGHMSDLEAYSVAAYLKSLPAVKHHLPEKIAPGKPVKGAALVFPPPPAWDAPKATPGG